MKYEVALALARELRKNQTRGERKFWDKVRNRQFMGLKFNRQFIIEHDDILRKKSYFIVDFYCFEKKTIVEIDGKIHEKHKKYDLQREQILIAHGFQIIRFTNKDVLNHWDQVEKKLWVFMELSNTPT